MSRVSATVVALLLAGSACTETGPGVDGNGDVVTETRIMAPFDSVRASNGVALDLVIDAAATGDVDVDVAVEASTDSNLIEYLITEVDGTTLQATVDAPSGGASATDGFDVSATIAVLESVSMNDGAVATISGVDGDLRVDADNGSVGTIAGSGAILNLDVDNGAVVAADPFTVGVAEVDADNGAVVSICATESVTGSVKNGAVLSVGCGGDITGVTTSNGGVLNAD